MGYDTDLDPIFDGFRNRFTEQDVKLTDHETRLGVLEEEPDPVPPAPTPTPSTKSYGFVEIASFAGATWDDKLTAAITHARQQTYPPGLGLPCNEPNALFTRPRDVYPGLSLRGPHGANEQPRSGNPYPCMIKVRMPAQADKNKPLAWWNWTASQTFGTYFGHFSAQGDSNTQMFRTAPGCVSWRGVFDTLATSGFRHIWGRPNEKFLNTAVDLAIGPQNHNNVLGACGTFGGSDSMFGDGSRILIDCPPVFDNVARRTLDGSGRPQPFLIFDYQEKVTIQGLFITVREATALVINGNANTDAIRVRDCELEGRNSGDPCFGSVVRVNGGAGVDITSCWISYGGSNFAQGSNPSDAGAALTVAGGDVILDKPKYGKADSVSDSVPAYVVTGGKLEIVRARATNNGPMPGVRKTGTGVLMHDNSVRVI